MFRRFARWWPAALAATVLMFSVAPVRGHGGKVHTETVTALAAVQMVLPMFDALVAKNKIDARWETTLRDVTVVPWSGAGAGGWMVRFTRTDGQPAALYIFLDPKGGYAGSNFTGPQ